MIPSSEQLYGLPLCSLERGIAWSLSLPFWGASVLRVLLPDLVTTVQVTDSTGRSQSQACALLKYGFIHSGVCLCLLASVCESCPYAPVLDSTPRLISDRAKESEREKTCFQSLYVWRGRKRPLCMRSRVLCSCRCLVYDLCVPM